MIEELEHNAVCPIVAYHDKNTCPFLGHEQDFYSLKDFLYELFEDPLRAARGMIYAVGFMLMLYAIVVMWWIAF